MSTNMAAQESTWLLQLTLDLHQLTDYSLKLHCNYQSATRQSEEPVSFARIKLIEEHHQFLSEKVLLKEICDGA